MRLSAGQSRMSTFKIKDEANIYEGSDGWVDIYTKRDMIKNNVIQAGIR